MYTTIQYAIAGVREKNNRDCLHHYKLLTLHYVFGRIMPYTWQPAVWYYGIMETTLGREAYNRTYFL